MSLRPWAGMYIPLAQTEPGFDGTCLHLFPRFFTSAPWKHKVEGHLGEGVRQYYFHMGLKIKRL